jgi:hypothetical protein
MRPKDRSLNGIDSTVVEEPFEERWKMTGSDEKVVNGSWHVMLDRMIVADGIERVEVQQNNWQEVRRVENLLAGTAISLLHMESHPRKEIPLRKMEEGLCTD